MTTPALFKEYIWLVNTIWRARRITFDEIQEKWLDTELSGGVEYNVPFSLDRSKSFLSQL